MITWTQAKAGIRVRTSTRIPTQDQDSGKVIDTNEMSAVGNECLVAWDSGVRTWTDRASLFAVAK